MKRFLASLLLTLAAFATFPALALDQATPPPKFPLAWGASAGGAYLRSIPTTSQIGIQNCAASLTDGFPPLTFVPGTAGGCPPFGQDFNGILKQLSQGVQWQQAGGPYFFDSAFAASVGGYPKGAIINSTVVPGNQWLSTADSNSNDPDAGGANWVQLPTQIQTGAPVASLSTTIPTGYVSANGLTIGNAASNGTNRANSDTKFLFAFVWAACPNTICPIFTSGGISSTRGATAAADYAANKALAVQNMNGAALMGADSQNGTTTSNLLNVPATSGSRTAPNSILGENLHSLSSAENGTHTHANTLTDPGHSHTVPIQLATIATTDVTGNRSVNSSNTSSSTNTTGVTINNVASGSGTAHNTVARSTIVYWNLKL
jgi:hypothetical protein